MAEEAWPPPGVAEDPSFEARMRAVERQQRALFEQELDRIDLQRRTVMDVLRQAMHQDQAVTLHLEGGHCIRGPLAMIGRDYVTVTAAGGPVQVPVASTVRKGRLGTPYQAPRVRVVVHPDQQEGATEAPQEAPRRTWLRHLQELTVEETPPQVEIGDWLGGILTGRLISRGADEHLYLEDQAGQMVVEPISGVTWLRRAGG